MLLIVVCRLINDAHALVNNEVHHFAGPPGGPHHACHSNVSIFTSRYVSWAYAQQRKNAKNALKSVQNVFSLRFVTSGEDLLLICIRYTVCPLAACCFVTWCHYICSWNLFFFLFMKKNTLLAIPWWQYGVFVMDMGCLAGEQMYILRWIWKKKSNQGSWTI